MTTKSKKVDLNSNDDMSSIVNQMVSAKTGKKFNLKLIGAIIAYFLLCGAGVNIYWLVLIIKYIF